MKLCDIHSLKHGINEIFVNNEKFFVMLDFFKKDETKDEIFKNQSGKNAKKAKNISQNTGQGKCGDDFENLGSKNIAVFSSICPHQGAILDVFTDDKNESGFETASEKRVALETKNKNLDSKKCQINECQIICKVHNWQFDSTGKCVNIANASLFRVEFFIEENAIFIANKSSVNKNEVQNEVKNANVYVNNNNGGGGPESLRLKRIS